MRCSDGSVVAFTSATHPGVEVTLNRDGFSLPPGFTVEVNSTDAVRRLHDEESVSLEEIPRRSWPS